MSLGTVLLIVLIPTLTLAIPILAPRHGLGYVSSDRLGLVILVVVLLVLTGHL